jgi:hypothetical protein
MAAGDINVPLGNRGDNLRKSNPNRPKGGAGGLEKGTKPLKFLLIEDVLQIPEFQEKMANGTFKTPLVFWLEILNREEDFPLKYRLIAANMLAKYMHKQMPVVVEQNIRDMDKQVEISFVGDIEFRNED